MSVAISQWLLRMPSTCALSWPIYQFTRADSYNYTPRRVTSEVSNYTAVCKYTNITTKHDVIRGVLLAIYRIQHKQQSSTYNITSTFRVPGTAVVLQSTYRTCHIYGKTVLRHRHQYCTFLFCYVSSLYLMPGRYEGMAYISLIENIRYILIFYGNLNVYYTYVYFHQTGLYLGQHIVRIMDLMQIGNRSACSHINPSPYCNHCNPVRGHRTGSNTIVTLEWKNTCTPGPHTERKNAKWYKRCMHIIGNWLLKVPGSAYPLPGMP